MTQHKCEYKINNKYLKWFENRKNIYLLVWDIYFNIFTIYF